MMADEHHSGQRQFLMRKVLLAVLICGVTISPLNKSYAQQSIDSQVTAQSQMWKGTIETASIVGRRRISLSGTLTNLTKYQAHVLAVGDFWVATNAGAEFYLENTSVGLLFCRENNNDTDNLDYCKKNKADKIDLYADMDPGENINFTLFFTPNDNVTVSAGHTISYRLRFLARYSEANPNPLLAGKPPGPAQTTTLNFPRIRLN